MFAWKGNLHLCNSPLSAVSSFIIVIHSPITWHPSLYFFAILFEICIILLRNQGENDILNYFDSLHPFCLLFIR